MSFFSPPAGPRCLLAAYYLLPPPLQKSVLTMTLVLLGIGAILLR